jgi:hypothetical protein
VHRRIDECAAVTVINMMTQPKARVGYIISDSAVTSPDGLLQRTCAKVIYGVSRFPWAMGVTGNVPSEILLRAIGEASPTSLKQLWKQLGPAMRRATAETASARDIPTTELFCQVKGIVWDFASKRPQGFVMQNVSGEMVGAGCVEPYVWYDTAWAMGTHEGAAQLLGREINLTDPASFDPEQDGVDLVTAQRRGVTINITPGIAAGHCRIGGEIHLTEVRKTGVQVFAIGEFPDPIGKHIDANRQAVACR